MKLKESIAQLRKYMESFEFQPGDKVRITGQVNNQGKIGKIIERASSIDIYLVDVSGNKGYYHGSDLKLIRREAQAQQFNKGAKVKTSEGMVGTITKTMIENKKVLHWVNHQGPFLEKELSRG